MYIRQSILISDNHRAHNPHIKKILIRINTIPVTIKTHTYSHAGIANAAPDATGRETTPAPAACRTRQNII